MTLGSDEIEDRFGYHRATTDTAQTHAQVRIGFQSHAIALDELLPDGREKALAMTALQEAMMWANAAIARQDPVDTVTPHLPNAGVDVTVRPST